MSQTKTVKVANATKIELEKIAVVLGVEAKDGEHHNQLRSRVAQALGGADEFLLQVDEAPVAQVTAPLLKGEALPGVGKRKISILIAASTEKGGERPIPVGVNGSVMWIPRGKKVDVPEPYVKVLRDAVQLHYEVDKDGQIVGEPREVQAYPFSEFGYAEAA